MKLIAEAGATKIQWGIVNENNVCEFITSGFNPNVSDRNYLRQLLLSGFPSEYKTDSIIEIQYYGAGCGTNENKKEVFRALSNFFTRADKIEIFSDLEAAGKAIFSNGDGYVGILGTGSSFGLYSNGKIIQQAPSLGYLIGDEGSGANMGKILIKELLHGKLPKDIEGKFYNEFCTNPKQLISELYKSKTPSAFLAGFTIFLKDNNNINSLSDIIMRSLDTYIELYVKPLVKNKIEIEIGFVGGIAYAFKSELNLLLRQYKLPSPIVFNRPFEKLIKL